MPNDSTTRRSNMAPDARRAQLLESARAVFADKGYHAASISDIIGHAGVARGTFYNHFKSKRAAFQALLDHLMEVVGQSVLPIDPTQAVAPQVRDNLTRLVSALTEREDLPRLLFGEALGIDAEGDAALAVFYRTALDRIEHALLLGQTFGVVAMRDRALTARCLLGLLKEPAFQASLHGEPLDAEALVDEIFAFLAEGVLTPQAGL